MDPYWKLEGYYYLTVKNLYFIREGRYERLNKLEKHIYYSLAVQISFICDNYSLENTENVLFVLFSERVAST